MTLKHRIAHNHILALSIGIIYLWFGTLKYFPNLSPAEELAQNTIGIMTFSLVPPKVSIILIAILETLIGLLLILNIWRRFAVIIALGHITLTFITLVLFPDLLFKDNPFQLTLLGQYVLKNLIIIAGLITLYKQSKGQAQPH